MTRTPKRWGSFLTPTYTLQGVVQEFPRPEGEGVVRVLDGIDLQIEKARHLLLLGPSAAAADTVLIGL